MENAVESRSPIHTLASPASILVATNLSDFEDLMPHIIAQAKAAGARVTLFHAIPILLNVGKVPFNQTETDHDVRLMLLGMAEQLERFGISCDISIRHDSPADAICAEIASTGATRLIMATHGRRKLAQVVLGSVANELFARVDIPVFGVGPHVHGAPEHVQPKRILHPISLLGDYRRSFKFAADLAQTYHAELTLLHVLSPGAHGQINQDSYTWAENTLSALLPSPREQHFPVQIRVASGDLVKEVLHAAAATRADWIVLGVDGVYPFATFGDSTAYKLLASADRPVLALRHKPSNGKAAIDEAD